MSSGGLSARHERVGQIFLGAAELEGEARERFLQEACADDATLRADVELMLRHDDPTALEGARHRRGVPSAASLLTPPDDSTPNEHVDGFELLEVLGHGSMGVVYLARQQHPEREVALKLLHPSLLGSSAAKRFTREVQFLAKLSHPGIAQIYGSGMHASETGERPYLVMEHIRGLPLTDYAREARLDTVERLQLVRRVCAAVQHAHERGVVHRDLKPANILVTESGQPKLVDFGAAGAMDISRQTRTMLTATGEWIGTVAYMSPEQWDASRHGVDERADVYALGVMLYELLSGKQPHDLGTRSLPEALKLLQEKEPEPLSRIDRRLAGDIETLVNTAMARDRRKRYASARELALDLQRYLEAKPLSARPPGFAQVLGQRIRRHPVFSAVLASMLIGITAFAFVQRAHSDEIAKELQHTRQVSEFVARFIKSQPDQYFASEETVQQMLERAEEFVTEAAVSPVVEGGFRVLVGNAYRMHAPTKLDDAEQHIARGVELLVQAHGERDRRSLQALLDLVTLQIERMRFEEAEQQLALLEARLVGAPDAAGLRLRAVHRRGMLAERRGDTVAMRAAYERVARIGPSVLPLDDRALRDAILRLAELDLDQDGLQRATEYVARCEAELGEAHPVTLGTRLAWANVLRGRGQRTGDTSLLHESLALIEENARMTDAQLGACAPRAIEAWIEVVSLHADLGALDLAESVMRDQFERCPSTPERTRISAMRHWTLGNLLLRQMLVTEAHEELAAAYAHLPENPADDPRLHVIIILDMAQTLRSTDRIDAAIEHLREAHELTTRLMGEGHRYTQRVSRRLERYEAVLAGAVVEPSDATLEDPEQLSANADSDS
ncbi:MAG: hypothetical protein DHS20C15_12820 [Planctomycetota bacterium]|nr:MAG: hypothetical protein DHS20C15_12820 [Planctomycetota bacterium]